MRSLWFCVIVLLIAALTTATAQQAFNLKYKFDEGKVYRYSHTMDVNSIQEMMGQEMKVSSKISAVTRVLAERTAGDGSISLVISMDTMKLGMKNPRVDTTLYPTEILHKRSRLSISQSGKLGQREVIDSISAAMAMRGTGGTVGQRDLLRFHILNGKPVKAGEKWTAVVNDTVEQMGGKTVVLQNIEYTTVGRETYGGKSCVKFTYTGKSQMNSKGTMQGMDVFTEGGGTTSGTVYFDDKACLMMADEGKADMEMTAAITGAQNMTIPITQTIVYTHVLLPR